MEKLFENETSNVGVKVNGYVKLSEMTSKDILSLPVYNANLVKTTSKRKQVYYKLVIAFNDLLKIEKPLQPKEYNLVVLERKLSFDLSIQGLKIPARLLTGKSTSGRDWYRYELFVSKHFRVNAFFDDVDVSLIKAAGIKLDFITSDEKFSDDVFTAFTEEDFE